MVDDPFNIEDQNASSPLAKLPDNPWTSRTFRITIQQILAWEVKDKVCSALESAGWAFATNLQLVFIFFDNWNHLPFKFLFPQLLLSWKIRFTAFVLKIWIIRMWLESNSRYLCHLQELAEMIFQSAL
jgi:hypothetical protein